MPVRAELSPEPSAEETEAVLAALADAAAPAGGAWAAAALAEGVEQDPPDP